MFTNFPQTAVEALEWGWSRYQPYFEELNNRQLTVETVQGWLADWSRWISLVYEVRYRLELATLIDTADEAAKKSYEAYLDDVAPGFEPANQQLKEKLLASQIDIQDFDIPLKRMRWEAEIYRAENVPLLTEERKLSNEYFEITGAQTVVWEGEEVPIQRLYPHLESRERSVREKAFRTLYERRLLDRDKLNEVWVRLMEVRRKMAQNAGFAEYRSFRWKQLGRLDYTPEDTKHFHAAVEEVVLPAVKRLYEKRRAKLGVERLRPWDLSVDPDNRPPLRPFEKVDELNAVLSTMFHTLDPKLGGYFDIMVQEKLLDLESRKGKAPGGVQYPLPLAQRPFIFMNAVGMHDDVVTMMHESGHAFQSFEMNALPYYQQTEIGMEIAEVASMAMELLGAPYLTKAKGGFYSEAEAAQAGLQHLEGILSGWLQIALVDAFQHWIYENHELASDPAACEEKYAELMERFNAGVDWGGLEREKRFWQRILHIYEVPFYFIEYGLAQLGAVQIWGNSLENPAQGLQMYRQALALGATRSLGELYAAAGAKFAFDAGTLGKAVALIESKIIELEPLAG